jgi:hypothetical protein
MNKTSSPIRTILLLWLGWFLLLFAIQKVALLRFEFKRPDYAVAWTANETRAPAPKTEPYLIDPFMNQQVAWDSEYYISITLHGYDDPAVDVLVDRETGRIFTKNYAFFPFYPLVMKVFYTLLTPLTGAMTDVARATLAGVIVSLLGTLLALFALYDLLKDQVDENTRMRALFYFLIFPSACFLAVVYTEGLFMGIAFSVLALNKRGQWLAASLLAFLAPWTRAVGAALVVPLLVTWFLSIDWKSPLKPQIRPRFIVQGLLALSPAISYFAWRTSNLGTGWEVAQQWFGRVELGFGATLDAYRWQFEHTAHNLQSQVYFGLEFFCLTLAVLACLILLRKDPAISLFGLAVVILSTFSGGGQGLARYVLPVIPMYVLLARLGRNTVFDRLWTIASVFAMGISAALFAFDFWIG